MNAQLLNNLRLYTKGRVELPDLQNILDRYYDETDPSASLVRAMNDVEIFNILSPWDKIYWRLRLEFPRAPDRQIKLLSIKAWNQVGQVDRAYQLARSQILSSI